LPSSPAHTPSPLFFSLSCLSKGAILRQPNADAFASRLLRRAADLKALLSFIYDTQAHEGGLRGSSGVDGPSGASEDSSGADVGVWVPLEKGGGSVVTELADLIESVVSELEVDNSDSRREKQEAAAALGVAQLVGESLAVWPSGRVLKVSLDFFFKVNAIFFNLC
jgi:hypothetical protein